MSARGVQMWREDECTCPKATRPLGRLYGISMGEGLVRLRTDPACPVHGEEKPSQEPLEAPESP